MRWQHGDRGINLKEIESYGYLTYHIQEPQKPFLWGVGMEGVFKGGEGGSQNWTSGKILIIMW